MSTSLEDYNKWIDSQITSTDNIAPVTKKISFSCSNHDGGYPRSGGVGLPSGVKRCEEFNDAPTGKNNVTQYWCIYLSFIERFGNTGSNIPDTHSVLDNKKQKCDEYGYSSSAQIRCVSYKHNVLTSCIGHKLISYDVQNLSDNFPNIKIGSKITVEFYNNFVDIINFLINERKKSYKYKARYEGKIGDYDAVNELARIQNITNLSIDYNTYMSNIITTLSKLLLSSYNNHDTSTPSEKFKILKDITYSLTGSSNYSSLDTNPLTNTKYKPSMVLNKDNIKMISKVIKLDLNDCICYSDCNGYSVCYCYGNCNHY